MDGLIPLELVVTDVKEGSRIPWFHYADGEILADVKHPLPNVSVPDVIQIVVVPAGKYTITLPAKPGFVLVVRQHRVVIASGTTSFSFAIFTSNSSTHRFSTARSRVSRAATSFFSTSSRSFARVWIASVFSAASRNASACPRASAPAG